MKRIKYFKINNQTCKTQRLVTKGNPLKNSLKVKPYGAAKSRKVNLIIWRTITSNNQLQNLCNSTLLLAWTKDPFVFYHSSSQNLWRSSNVDFPSGTPEAEIQSMLLHTQSTITHKKIWKIPWKFSSEFSLINTQNILCKIRGLKSLRRYKTESL